MGYVEVSESFVDKLQLSSGPLLFQTGLFGMHTLLVFLSVYILSCVHYMLSPLEASAHSLSVGKGSA